ncbi:hypothetical protein ACLB1R_26650 [Escherichia coli]
MMDFFMSGNRASRRDEHNQQQAHYATGNQNPDQHIPCADTNHRSQPIHSDEPQTCAIPKVELATPARNENGPNA